RRENIFEALTGHQMSIRSDLARRGFAERSWFSLIGDTHVLWLPGTFRDALEGVPHPFQTLRQLKNKKGHQPYRMMAPRGVVSWTLHHPVGRMTVTTTRTDPSAWGPST